MRHRKGSTTTHRVTGGCLGQLDLPVHPGHLTAVRVVEANVPRITGPDWLIFHPSVIAFEIMLPDGLAPGAVVEWDDRPGGDWDCWYTVVTAVSATSVTVTHCGRGPDGALAAAVKSSGMRSAA